MRDEKKVFSDKYIKSTTNTKSSEAKKPSHDIDIDLEKEKRYSSSKPRRTILRARIIHDKS